ncbi:MAG: AEC family transporter [Oculatellaceae cyanobacterium Prado106]|jgi:hypothetical protein|nr:AEC family transporter [Oculatellaceae cyanobacterium Prado106]
MTETLIQAYTPLIFWTGLGIIICRFLPNSFPRLLGRSLYWVGIPIEIFALARQTEFSPQAGLAPLITIGSLVSALGMAWVTLALILNRQRSLQALPSPPPPDSPTPSETPIAAPDLAKEPLPEEPSFAEPELLSLAESRSRQGSFLVSSMLGNTGFVGLAVAPVFISPPDQSWLVLYSVTQNVVGTYGIGVFLASYFGRSPQGNRALQLLRDVITVPSLWAFAIGLLTRAISLPEIVESGIHASIWLVIPAALLLMGMRLSQLRGWKSLKGAIAPTILKAIVLPIVVGLAGLGLHLPADPRLALVLMAGMPTAFAGLILAEEYELDRELIASSIVLTTVLLLVTIPIWLLVFG